MRTVLLADDNRECLRSLARMLDRYGLRTLPAANAAEVWRALERTVLDLAILDLEMPSVGGLHILQRIRRRHPRLPVVILSGADSARTILRSFAAGAYGFLPKPVNVKLLRQLLREVLASTPPVPFNYLPPPHDERKPHA